MALYELVTVDGGPPETPQGGLPDVQRMHTDMQTLLRGQQQMMSVLIAQQAQIEKLNQALATVRISRSQEMSLKEAIRARAKQLAVLEGLGADAERRIAGAIRVTMRETTGARAIGDLASSQFDRALAMVNSWHMAGALRKIRREMKKP